MKSSILIAATAMLCAFPSETLAQSHVEVTKTQIFRQEETPELMDNYQYTSYFSHGKQTYNLKGFALSSTAKVIDMKVNPAGFSYAVLSGKATKTTLSIYDVVEANKVLYKFKNLTNATAICYSADSRILYVATLGSGITAYETKGYTQINHISVPGTISRMEASTNGYFIAATTNEQQVHIVNLQTNSVRLSIPAVGMPRCVRFSDDTSRLGILTANQLKIYNTIDFKEDITFNDLSVASSFDFHPEGKFVTIATDGKELGFYNMIDKTDKANLVEPTGNVSTVRYLKDAKNNSYLSYSAQSSIIYKMIKGLAPHYTQMMRDELNARMMEWCKRLPGESDAAFEERVNEETMAKQKQLFANEISTRLAGDMISGASLKLGNYNPANNMLTLDMGNMGPVYLKVPQAELATFNDPANLEFSDVQYGLTKDDRFEMIYAKVRNKATGKEYIFDNLERQSLDFLTTDDSFVPLELMQQAGREDLALQGVAANIINDARQKNVISDHTNISVNANVVSDYDANGRRINNYKVDFNYNVDADYSLKDDFAAGKYKIEESNAAMSMLAIVIKAFSEDFAKYIMPGKKLVISVTGSADATPIRGSIAYDGCYGEFENEPYYLGASLSNLTITKATGIKSNEQLAFMRAQGVTSYLNKNLKSVSGMDINYKYSVEVAEDKGSEFRRIGVTFTFVDAF